MEEFFGPVFSSTEVTASGFFQVLAAAIGIGVLFSGMCYFKSGSSKSFYITTSLLPASVAMVIMLVNGNIGAGVAVAGAFGLVRFRSAQGSAKEICIIFIAMASGLALGMGYLAYSAIFTVLAGGILMLFSAFRLWERKPDKRNKILKITIPEDLDYGSVFDDLFVRYTDKAELVKVKTTNLGSMFQLTYQITIKDYALEKDFIDEIRCRNGNLEIMVERINFDKQDL